MNIYDCKVGDIVMTGDSYGMDPCVCIKAEYANYKVGGTFVDFLDLTSGKVHCSGCAPGNEAYLDDCYYLTSITKEQVEEIKRVWGVKDD